MRNLSPTEQEVVPYFQPIISLQSMRIIAYGSLGRRLCNGEVQSLGPFFNDPLVPEKTRLRIDRLLRESAVKKWAGATNDILLSINLKPSWIYSAWKERGILYTLTLLDEYGVDPKKIVIEITEEEFNGNLEDLREVLKEYRKQGCTIAMTSGSDTVILTGSPCCSRTY